MAIFYFEYLLFVVGIFIRYSVLPEINQEEENKEVDTDKGNHIPLFYNFHIY